jgi:hypothetical protein
VLVTNAMEAIGFELAADFSASRPIWSAWADGAYEVDVSADGRFATLSGDVRVLLDARDGRRLWSDPEFPRELSNIGICFGGQFRFSPDGRWVAGKRHASDVDVFALDDMSLVSRIRTTDCARGVMFSPDSAILHTPEVSVPTTSWLPPGERQYIGSDAFVGKLPREYIELAPNGKDRIFTGWTGDQGWRSSYNGGPPLLSATAAPSHPRAPRFSREGHWVVLGGTLVHLPSGEIRLLDLAATEGLFAPNGDVIFGERDESIARFCRTPSASP